MQLQAAVNGADHTGRHHEKRNSALLDVQQRNRKTRNNLYTFSRRIINASSTSLFRLLRQTIEMQQKTNRYRKENTMTAEMKLTERDKRAIKLVAKLTDYEMFGLECFAAGIKDKAEEMKTTTKTEEKTA